MWKIVKLIFMFLSQSAIKTVTSLKGENVKGLNVCDLSFNKSI